VRRVLNSGNAARSAASASLLPAGLLPDPDHLARARGLAARFPEAHLREITLVRSPFPGGAGRTWLALECMQVTGSFKVRGALLAMEARQKAAAAQGKSLEVLAVSAGNHGIGVSFAAKALGAKATIMVPRGAPKTKTDKIAGYGATVLFAQSTGYDDAEVEAIALAAERGLPFLSPYDDLDVLAGNGASLGYEIERALGKAPQLVIAPIGGGGLATGLACALAQSSVCVCVVTREWSRRDDAPAGRDARRRARGRHLRTRIRTR
jgi:threonine dehydratase